MKLPFRRSAAFCGMVMLTTLASLLTVYAQQTLGSISGAVLDNSGGAVVGATVTIVNDQTSATRTEASGTAGIYLFKDLAVGRPHGYGEHQSQARRRERNRGSLRYRAVGRH
jgi:hypothetical protein